MTDKADLHELCKDLVGAAAGLAAHSYNKFVTPEDCRQEIWSWVCGYNLRTGVLNETLVREWLEPADPEDYRLGAFQARREFYRVAKRFCEREKATKSGYEPEDQFYFTRGLVKQLLDLHWNQVPLSDIDQSMPRSKGDPAEGGNLEIMLLDIRRGLGELTPDEAWTLKAHLEGIDMARIAEETGMALSTAYARVGRSLDKLVEALGGVSPY